MKSKRNFSKFMFYLLFFLIFLIGAFSNELQAQTKVLNNGALRFGTGSENSLNTQGNLQQPFVYNLDLNQWRKLTFGTHPLNLSIAVGGNGENEWNLNGTRFDNPTPSNKVDDYSDFTFTTAPNGYGIIVTRGDITISHSGTTYNLELENKYELRDDKSYLKVTSTIRNTGATTLTNLRYWVGTPDDWIGTSDAPRKERGNIVDGAFVQISAVSERALAQRVTSGQEGVMFYSNSEKANNTIATSYGWTNIINQNPFTAPIDIGGDRAYAFYVRMYDVAPGQSDSFTWYYAAGRLSDLDAIIADVAADIAANTNENIAPILDNSQNPVLTTIEKNSFTSNGNTISEIVVDGSITDEDGFLGKAVAVIGTDNSNGAWQFSLDAGVSWQAVLNASDENALLLGPDDKLRFVPNADWFGTSTFTFRAWDRSDGSAGDYWNTQGGGGSLPFSVLFDDATITVMDVLVNNAPVLDPAYTHLLSSITTNNTTNSGNSVTEIVADGSITDPDGPAFKSIAVIGVDDLNGVWQYSLNSIAWSAIAPVSNNSALLLDANHRIRFIPNSDWTGVSTFTFRAWDKTSGVSGNKVDVSVNGNPTAFSIASDIASITVAFANNAPILNVGDNAPFLAPINMNNFNSSGNTINEIIPDGAITDPDGPIAKAVAAFDFDNTNGMWQYSANNGATWIDATVATQGNAILFDSNYRVRFVPVSDWYGTPIFMIRAWDKSAGTPGERANASLNGSNHPFSSAESPIYINVKQVLPPVAPVANDATLISTTGFTANWSASSGATSYRLDVSTNSGFSSFVADYEDKELGNVLSIEITGLTAGNTYYYRVRAGGIGGIGDNSNIITTITTPPAPVANDATLISTTGFTANWSAANGAASYRLDVSTNNVFSDYVSGYEGKVLGNVTSSVVSGLTAGNTYYYRVRTVNSGGTSVNSNTITTVTHHLPTVTTQAVSSINTTTATGNGNITALGVPNPTQHGHVWSTSTNPTLSSHVGGGVSTIGVASVTGAFTSSITGLTIGPVYYVRAYATNSAGTVYGAEVSFTTHQVPTVTTQEVSSINTTTATGNGNITALGVPNPTQHGHVWNTEEDPTTSNSKTEKGAVSSTGAFTSSITELTPGTVYYVKAYATNSSGTVYGAQVSFRTTPPAPKNLAFELNKKQSVKFTWSDDDEAENLTGYQIALQSSDFSETQVVIADFTTPSAIRVYDYTPENPFASGEHDYKIRARYNFFGSEFYSDSVNFETIHVSDLNEVRDLAHELKFDNTNAYSVELTWKAPDLNANGFHKPALLGFKVYIEDDNRTRDLSTDNTGFSSVSNQFTTKSKSLLDSANKPNLINKQIMRDEINYVEVSELSTDVKFIQEDTNETTYTFNYILPNESETISLPKDKTYKFKVVAVYVGGESNGAFRNADFVKYPKPQSFTANNEPVESNDKIILTWQAPALTITGQEILSYYIEEKTDNGSFSSKLNYILSGTTPSGISIEDNIYSYEFTLTGYNSAEYKIYARYKDSGVTTYQSAEASDSPLKVWELKPATALTASTTETNNTVILTWNVDEQTKEGITGYNIFRNDTQLTTNQAISIIENEGQYTVSYTRNQPGFEESTYTIEVVYTSGTSAKSSEASVTIHEFPKPVASQTPVSALKQTVNLYWEKPVMTTVSAPRSLFTRELIGYRVYSDEAGNNLAYKIEEDQAIPLDETILTSTATAITFDFTNTGDIKFSIRAVYESSTVRSNELRSNLSANNISQMTNKKSKNRTTDLSEPLVFSELTLEHFTRVWSGNGYNHMNFFVHNEYIDGYMFKEFDEIAVFDGEKCVGYAVIRKNQEQELINPIRIITSQYTNAEHDGFTPGNDIKIKIWSNYPYTQGIGAPIIIEGIIPDIFNFNGENTPAHYTKFYANATARVHLIDNIDYNQTIQLRRGWNIISTYLNMGNELPPVRNANHPRHLISAFGDLFDADSYQSSSIKKVIPEYGTPIAFDEIWAGTEMNFDFNQSYRVYISNHGEFTVSGKTVRGGTPADMKLAVNSPGWYLFSVPYESVINIPTFFGVNMDKVIRILSETGQLYENGDNANPDIVQEFTELIPGKGYYVNVSEAFADGFHAYERNYNDRKRAASNILISANQVESLNHKQDLRMQRNDETDNYYETVWSGNGSMHFNLFVEINDYFNSFLNAGAEIALFDGEDCVGVSVYTDQANFISVKASMADEFDPGYTPGNAFSIRIWNPDTETEIINPQYEVLEGTTQFEVMGITKIRITDFTSETEEVVLPLVSGINAIYPNPFNPETNIRFSNGVAGNISLEIYNVKGQKVKTLVSGYHASGNYSVIWNGTDNEHKKVASGIYFTKLTTPDKQIIRKMVLIK